MKVTNKIKITDIMVDLLALFLIFLNSYIILRLPDLFFYKNSIGGVESNLLENRGISGGVDLLEEEVLLYTVPISLFEPDSIREDEIIYKLRNKGFFVTNTVSSLSFSNALKYEKQFSNLPVYSQDEIRVYASTLVEAGSRYIYSDSLLYSTDSIVNCSVEGYSFDNVMDKLFKTKFKYRVSDLSDKVYGYIFLYDRYGEPIFKGVSESDVLYLKEGGMPFYRIDLAEFVPLPIASYKCEIFLINDDNLSYTNFCIQKDKNGRVLFPTYFAGSYGVLVVQNEDGVFTYYDLWRPGFVYSNGFSLINNKNNYDFYIRDDSFELEMIQIHDIPVLITLNILAESSVIYFNVKMLKNGLVAQPNSIIFHTPLHKELSFRENKIIKLPRGKFTIEFK
jgi:hypothetical protein